MTASKKRKRVEHMFLNWRNQTKIKYEQVLVFHVRRVEQAVWHKFY
jgi:hypothetical protein